MITTDLWRKWTIHCALGELLGIACAGAIAFGVHYAIGEPDSSQNKMIVLLAMMCAGFIEGAVLSLFQWKILVTKFNAVPRREWMFYTILVGILGWFLGMLPSLFFMPVDSSAQDVNDFSGFSNPFVFVAICMSLGAFLGALFGLFQWFSLRKYADQAYNWIIANALGWSLGLGWIYLFASFPTEESSMVFNIFMGILGGLLAGLTVGGVTGLFLVKMNHISK